MEENTVLYRKYRSQSFKDVMGQGKIVEILTRSIFTKNVSHAYLFTGPRGTGKTTLARLMAKGVNCLRFEELKDVCNECENCLSINSLSANDIIEMDAASNRGIDEIRNLKESINYLPSFLKKKVYIIDEAHMLTKEAFNSLLKTLEEPPAHIMFVLATTEAHKIPVTILSRVERYDLALASEADLIKKLNYIVQSEKVEIEDSVLSLLYKKSGGSFRDAESILSKLINKEQDSKITIDEAQKVLGVLSDDLLDSLIASLNNLELTQSLDLIEEYISKGYSVNNILDSLLERIYILIIANLKDAALLNSYIRLINFVVTVKQTSKDFADKNLILNLEIIRFCSKNTDLQNLRNQANSPINQVNLAERFVKKEVISESKSLISQSIQNDNHVKSGDYSSESLTTGQILERFRELVIHKAKNDYPRLRSILLNSKLMIESESLVVEVNYDMNIQFLNKVEIKDYLLNNIKLLKQDVKTILVRLINDQIGTIASLDSPENNENIGVIVNKNSNIEVNLPKKSNIDNTELIESSI